MSAAVNLSKLQDTGSGSPGAADSPPVAPRKIQTGQNPLSAVAKNLVPQTGQVCASCCTDTTSLPGSSTDPPDSAFTAPAVLQRRLSQRRARGSLPQAWQLVPRHLPLSCRSVSSGTHFEPNSNGTVKIFHSFRHRLHSPRKSIGRALRGTEQDHTGEDPGMEAIIPCSDRGRPACSSQGADLREHTSPAIPQPLFAKGAPATATQAAFSTAFRWHRIRTPPEHEVSQQL